MSKISTIIARRDKAPNEQYKALLTYFLLDEELTIETVENPACVDGIGGVIWEGSLVLSR